MKELNLYHKIAFGILCAGAFTNTYLLSPHLLLIRLGVLLVFCGLFFSKRIQLNAAFYAVCIFFFFYIAYTLLITMIYGRVANLSTITDYLFILLLVIASLWFFCSRPSDNLRFFYYICCINVIASFVIAMIEISTGWHLPTSNIHLLENQSIATNGYPNFPTGFFHNKNDFAVVFTLSFCYLMAYRIHFFRNRKKWVDWIFLTMCIALQWMVKCRTAIITVAIFLLFTQRKKLSRHKMFLCISGVLFLIAVVVTFFFFHFNSTSIRTNLYLYSFASLFDSYCIGFGVEGDLYYYSQMDNYNLFSQIINAHSYLLQLLLTSGALFFIGYIVMLICLMREIAIRHGRNEFWIMIPLYVLLLFAPSGSNCLWVHYLFLGTFVGYACLHPTLYETKRELLCN